MVKRQWRQDKNRRAKQFSVKPVQATHSPGASSSLIKLKANHRALALNPYVGGVFGSTLNVLVGTSMLSSCRWGGGGNFGVVYNTWRTPIMGGEARGVRVVRTTHLDDRVCPAKAPVTPEPGRGLVHPAARPVDGVGKGRVGVLDLQWREKRKK